MPDGRKAILYDKAMELSPLAVSVGGRSDGPAESCRFHFDDFVMELRPPTEKEKRDRRQVEREMAKQVWDEERGWHLPDA